MSVNEGGGTPPDVPSAEEPPFLALLNAIDRLLAKVEEMGLAFFLVVLIAVGVYQTVKRNFFPPAAFWTDEIIRYSTFAIGLIGTALAAQSSRLINIDMLTRLFPPRGRLVLRMLTAVATVVICAFWFQGSLAVRDIIMEEKGELIRTATLWLVMPIAMALIAVHMALHLVADAYHLATGRMPSELVKLEPKE